jgi:hypothetical protein
MFSESLEARPCTGRPDTQHNDNQLNDIQHNNNWNATLSITIVIINALD